MSKPQSARWLVHFIAPTPARAEAISKAKFAEQAKWDSDHAQHQAMVRIAIASLPTKANHYVSVLCSGLIDAGNGHAVAKIEMRVELVRFEP